jgi:hypothetical protein
MRGALCACQLKHQLFKRPHLLEYLDSSPGTYTRRDCKRPDDARLTLTPGPVRSPP